MRLDCKCWQTDILVRSRQAFWLCEKNELKRQQQDTRDSMFTDGMGFILAETLVQNGTTGDNGNAGGTLNQPVPGFLEG